MLSFILFMYRGWGGDRTARGDKKNPERERRRYDRERERERGDKHLGANYV